MQKLGKSWDKLPRPAQIAIASLLTLIILSAIGKAFLLLERWRTGMAGTVLFVSLMILAVVCFWTVIIGAVTIKDDGPW